VRSEPQEGEVMSEPFIFIGTHRIKEGKSEEFKTDALDLVKLVQDRASAAGVQLLPERR
jgi:hypothetical protein